MSALRAVALALLTLVGGVGAVLLASQPMVQQARRPAWPPQAEAGAARLALIAGVPALLVEGDAEQRGRASARLVARQAADLFAIMRWNPRLALADAERLAAHIAEDDRREVLAFAECAGLDPQRLLVAQAILETLCTAAVHVPNALIARNMDFFPPVILARHTLLQVVRAPQAHAYLAVGWPGLVGVISGVNEHGLVACVLLNWLGDELPPAEPLALRARAILQRCRSVDEAWALFAQRPVGSPHFLLLADVRRALVAWWTLAGPRCDEAGPDGWLFASNWPRAGPLPRDGDVRGARLLAACRALPSPGDPEALRATLATSYLPGLNAQAMLFDLRRQRLHLALAEPGLPAACASWREIAWPPLFAAGQPVPQPRASAD
ncbi:MAG: C45 family peptidase [Planctomycetota bacterium]|nr:C45 family peptidase [Planctomycetota bacterium]MCX8038950.1 C45 family peptidase [Planctomycetota bacterium]MDW8372684.1 C45 family peptidase [Planctomycetota bacterium]